MENTTDRLLSYTREAYGKFADILPESELADRIKDVWDIVVAPLFIRKLANLSACESPIEKMLALCLWHKIEGFQFRHKIHLIPQWEIAAEGKTYRPDFYIECSTKANSWFIVKVLVECDGHDFHEKTKGQASRDKEKDRILVRNGYHILRYTGSEITKDPFKCADDIFDTLRKLLHEEAEGCQMSDGLK